MNTNNINIFATDKKKRRTYRRDMKREMMMMRMTSNVLSRILTKLLIIQSNYSNGMSPSIKTIRWRRLDEYFRTFALIHVTKQTTLATVMDKKVFDPLSCHAKSCTSRKVREDVLRVSWMLQKA
jgi:hypothetical protein